ncbi:MAG: acyl-CoA dehydratase activase [Desulfovermiculus sp.]
MKREMNPAMRRMYAKWLVRSYLWRSPVWRSRTRPVEDRIRYQTAWLLSQSFERSSLSVLSGFLVPAELLHLYKATPMFTEFLAPILSGTHMAPVCLEATENQGFSRDTCSFHRATLGAALKGYLPEYSLIVGTSHLCDGQNKTLEELALRTNRPYLLLDVPQEPTSQAITYLAAQLQELEDTLLQLSGQPRAGFADWESVFSLSNRTAELMHRVNQLRTRPECSLSGHVAFTLHLCSLLMMGTRFARDCYQDLAAQLEAEKNETDPKSQMPRLVWLLAYPYVPGNEIVNMEREWDMHVAADELSQVNWPKLDPHTPHESLARKMLSNPFLGPVHNRVEQVLRLVDQGQADGVIHFSHWGCRQGCGGVKPLFDALRERKIPCLEIHGDCIDSRHVSQEQIRTRLQGFAELLKRGKRPAPSSARHDGQVFLGVDIGSLTAKMALISSQGQILHTQIFSTGASSKKTAAKLENILEQGGWSSRIAGCVSTGYGRAAVTFAQTEITEISCHARGMAHLVPGVRTIIDIGGQDTKVIAVDSQGGVRTFQMNDKCAAGTGRFLEMMARTLEIDLEDMGDLAVKSRKAATISSLCTVFAESEVVSLIAEDTPVEVICKGVCRSIAKRTVSMLDRVGRKPRLAMSGGVAFNQGVVRELEHLTGCKLYIPENPQIMGALGAALFAAESTASS